MSAQHTPGPRVEVGPFGGHVVSFVVGVKRYSVVVAGSSTSVVCEYEVRNAQRGRASDFYTMRRNLPSEGRTALRFVSEARAAIAKATGSKQS